MRALALALSWLLASGCQAEDRSARHIVYWEKWTGFEAEAMERVVRAFNERERAHQRSDASYRPIEVELVPVSRVEQKLLVAIAGKTAPDLSGLYAYSVAAYAEKGALTELTPRLEAAGIHRSSYIPHFFDMGVIDGQVWSLPATPASIALHWNKRLFREAGLDPDTPPRTIEELDRFSEQLTKWEVTLSNGDTRVVRGYASDVPAARKRLLQAGFLASDPPWWSYVWGSFFGGHLVEGDRVSTDSPANVRAYEWVASYSQKLGVDALRRFRSGFGNFASSQNPFLSGKLAMQLQGVWMYNYIDKYAPAMQWGVAPFPYPADHPELANSTLAESDVLVIPKDSPHPDEAFEFVRYVNSQPAMEMLCLGQRKFSPLAEVSSEFYAHHPHPQIALFRELAESKNAFSAPQLGVWAEYDREMISGVDAIRSLTAPPRAVLAGVRERLQISVDREERLRARRASR